eukprot:gene3449-6085_t
MSQSITAFFKPKRSVEDNLTIGNADEHPTKKAASDEVKTSAALTPEQQNEVWQKKFLAASKLSLSKGIPLIGTVGDSWAQALRKEFKAEYYQKLIAFLTSEASSKKTIYPPADEVFSWTRACHIRDVKVVILGQLYDVEYEVVARFALIFQPPPSLVNIYKELEEDIDGFKRPNHGHLMSWSKQGVLLLNAVLTVRAREPASHAGKGWEQFTDAVISWIDKNLSNVVFILWGGYARKKGKKINKTKHFVLEGAHPSPLSVTKFRGLFRFLRS